MYRRGYRPSTVQRQQNDDRYEAGVTTTDKYRKHIDPSVVDQDGRNAVHLAVLVALRDPVTDGVKVADTASSIALDQAIRAGCDINAIDRWGRRPIHYAAEAGHIICLRRLIRHGVDPNALTGTVMPSIADAGSGKTPLGAGLSPLMVAAQSGRADAIRFLLKNGAKSSLTNSRSETAVHYAASSSSYPEACITALLGQHSGQPGGGSLIDHQDCDGSTALMVAARNQSSSKSAAAAAVSILLKLGADVSLVDNQQRTALHWAAQSNLPDVVTVLHAANIEVDAIDNFGDTAYVTAIKSNSPDALESLIRVGCDRSMIDGLMGTAVALAAVKGHAQVIETLVKNGEDPDDFGYFGKTPLMLAGFESHAEAVDMLLSLGADPDITSHTGGTALVSALLRTSSSNEVNRHRIVLSLIRAGVDVNQRPMLPDQKTATATNQFKAVCSSQHGRNWPLSYAIDTGYVSLIRILLIAGSRVPADEIRQRQLINTRFFDLDELLGPVLEWTSQPVSLQHASRAVIRQSILSGHYHCSSLPSEFNLEQAIRSLPIADRLMGYLNFAELDSIKIHRARVLDGAKPGMMQLGESTPCGMRAIEGTIRPTGPPAIAGHN